MPDTFGLLLNYVTVLPAVTHVLPIFENADFVSIYAGFGDSVTVLP